MKTAPPSAVLVVISAPSGAGKTTLCQGLLAVDSRITRAITCTTRAPRPGEKDGEDYHFFTSEAFRERVAQGAFIEHATVHGNSYGTLRSEVLDRLRSGRDVLLNIDVQGAASVRDCARHDEELRRALCSVFLVPPSMEELELRLRRRGQDAEEVIQRRLAVARDEMSHWRLFDYVVVSDTVPAGVARLRCIVEAERLKQWRVVPPVL